MSMFYFSVTGNMPLSTSCWKSQVDRVLLCSAPACRLPVDIWLDTMRRGCWARWVIGLVQQALLMFLCIYTAFLNFKTVIILYSKKINECISNSLSSNLKVSNSLYTQQDKVVKLFLACVALGWRLQDWFQVKTKKLFCLSRVLQIFHWKEWYKEVPM